jgi:LEA14-like dessication related protein
MSFRLVFLALCSSALLACGAAKGPELRVLGIDQRLGAAAPRHEVVFVQVTNPASRPMRLTKLEYTFASQGQDVSTGEVSLAREVPAGAAVILEVPLEIPADGELTLTGRLTATIDEIVRSFSVSAQIQTE